MFKQDLTLVHHQQRIGVGGLHHVGPITATLAAQSGVLDGWQILCRYGHVQRVRMGDRHGGHQLPLVCKAPAQLRKAVAGGVVKLDALVCRRWGALHPA